MLLLADDVNWTCSGSSLEQVFGLSWNKIIFPIRSYFVESKYMCLTFHDWTRVTRQLLAYMYRIYLVWLWMHYGASTRMSEINNEHTLHFS